MSQNPYPVGQCHECGKRSFVSRKAARGYIRRFFPSEQFTVYQCGEYWHFGHASYAVKRGFKERGRVSV